MIKTVIFDMDGTVLDTLGDLCDSMNAVLSEFFMPARTADEIRSFVGNGIPKLVKRAVPDGTDEKTLAACVDRMIEYYRGHCEIKTRPYGGIVPLLETLRERGVDTAVVTNKDDAAARALSGKFFGDLFGFVSGALPGQPLKPAPDAVLRAMRYFGASAGECIYIGDSDVDVMTAKNAGLASVGVLWGFRDRKTLEDAGADVIVSSPEEIAALFPDRRI